MTTPRFKVVGRIVVSDPPIDREDEDDLYGTLDDVDDVREEPTSKSVFAPDAKAFCRSMWKAYMRGSATEAERAKMQKRELEDDEEDAREEEVDDVDV